MAAVPSPSVPAGAHSGGEEAFAGMALDGVADERSVSDIRSSAATSRTMIVRPRAVSITPASRRCASCRLTVSMRRPRKSAISVRDRGRSNRAVFAGSRFAARRPHASQDEQDESGDLLLRALAAEQEHPLARGIDFVERALQEELLQLRPFVHEALELPPAEAAQLDGRGRLRGIAAARPERPTEEVRREQQLDDLLAAVGEGLGQLDHAGEDVGEPVLRVDVGDQPAGRIALAMGDPVERRQLLGRQGAA